MMKSRHFFLRANTESDCALYETAAHRRDSSQHYKIGILLSSLVVNGIRRSVLATSILRRLTPQ
jgi:hypothetical protein